MERLSDLTQRAWRDERIDEFLQYVQVLARCRPVDERTLSNLPSRVVSVLNKSGGRGFSRREHMGRCDVLAEAHKRVDVAPFLAHASGPDQFPQGRFFDANAKRSRARNRGMGF